MLEKLNSKSFSECLNTPFRIVEGDRELFAAELFEVTDKDLSPSMEQFSLMFRGPLTPVLSQGIRELEHEKLGRLRIFLVPVGPDESGMRYEAVFNRFRKTQ